MRRKTDIASDAVRSALSLMLLRLRAGYSSVRHQVHRASIGLPGYEVLTAP
jgi:hypothetical protein